LDAATGALKWQYPAPGDPPLYPPVPNPYLQWNYGIESSASYWHRGPVQDGGVIFGAQDPSLGPHGSARLFALNATTGAVIWKSDPIAVIDGTTNGSTTELHERIGFSSPLVLGNKVYVGIANNGDNPTQKGRVVAVDLATGHTDAGFHFRAVGTAASPPSTRGGGVWNSPASDGVGVYFTTGNTREDAAGVQMPEPKPNHGLSMIRVNKNTGHLIWAFQPVPYDLDDDPDWAAGVTIMHTSCGELIASVQKDGWAYAVEAGHGHPGILNVKWQFPATGFPFNASTIHGDTDYKRPGAAWNDVLIINTGGDVRGGKGGSIINTVARHRHDAALFAKLFYNSTLLIGQHFGLDLGNAETTRDRLCGGFVIPGQHDDAHALVGQRPQCSWCGRIDRGRAVLAQSLGFVFKRTDRDVQLGQESRIPEHEPPPLNPAEHALAGRGIELDDLSQRELAFRRRPRRLPAPADARSRARHWRGREPQDLLFIEAFARDQCDHLRLALRQGARLVDHERVNLLHALERFGVLDQHARLRFAADPHHD
jgi:outer membrane protein assembly factor BamB